MFVMHSVFKTGCCSFFPIIETIHITNGAILSPEVVNLFEVKSRLHDKTINEIAIFIN